MNSIYEGLNDATWNEKLAAGLLIGAIVLMGMAPFLINELINPGTEIIIRKVLGQSN